MIKYKTKFPVWNKQKPIEEVEVSRETENCVFIKVFDGHERRENKVTRDWFRYFDTMEQAKDFLVKSAEKEVINSENRLKIAKEDLEFVEAL